MQAINDDTPLAQRVAILTDACLTLESKVELLLTTCEALGHEVATLKGNANAATTQRDLGLYGTTNTAD